MILLFFNLLILLLGNKRIIYLKEFLIVKKGRKNTNFLHLIFVAFKPAVFTHPTSRVSSFSRRRPVALFSNGLRARGTFSCLTLERLLLCTIFRPFLLMWFRSFNLTWRTLQIRSCMRWRRRAAKLVLSTSQCLTDRTLRVRQLSIFVTEIIRWFVGFFIWQGEHSAQLDSKVKCSFF